MTAQRKLARRALAVAVTVVAMTPVGAAHATWSSPVSVSPAGEDLLGSSVEAVAAPDGTIYATWEMAIAGPPGTASRSMRLATITPSGSVASPVSITGPLPNSAWRDIAVGTDGSVAVAWITYYDGVGVSVQVVRVAGNGTVGSIHTLHNGPAAASNTKVVLDAAGQATVVWERESDSGSNAAHIVQAARLRPDGTMSAPQTLGSGFNLFLKAAVQPGGRVLVNWSGSRFTSLSSDGVQGPTTDLDPGQATSSIAALALAAAGEGIISWRRSSGEIATRRVRADGSLGPVVRLSPPAQNSRSEPDVGVSSNGLATTAWSDDQDVWIAQTTSDGSANAAVRLNVPGGSSNAEHAIAVDAAGTSTITWIDRRGGNDSSTWRVRAAVVPSSGVPQPSTIISGSGEPLGTTRTLAASTGTATALWQTFPGGIHPVVRMARSDGTPTGGGGGGEGSGTTTPPPITPPVITPGPTFPPVCTGVEAVCLPTPQPPSNSSQSSQPGSNPCKGVQGGLGAALVASLQCSAAQTARQVECGVNAALTVVIPLKALAFAKTAKGFYDLRRAQKKHTPLLRMYNKILLIKFSPKAPEGFRTGAEVVEQLLDAKTIFEVVRIVMTASTYIVGGSGDVSGLALDLLDIAGLKSCVEALAGAVE